MTVATDSMELVVAWLRDRVIADARGDTVTSLDVPPANRYWLGRLAPEDSVWARSMGERGQRLDPCATGFSFRPKDWTWDVTASFCTWSRDTDKSGGENWVKGPPVTVTVKVEIDAKPTSEPIAIAAEELTQAILESGDPHHSARLEVTVSPSPEFPRKSLDVELTVVNQTDSTKRGIDPNLYEVKLSAKVGEVQPILLDALPDSFRYDRRVTAFGINGGAYFDRGVLRTTDSYEAHRVRPGYWDSAIGGPPDLTFTSLSDDPLPQLARLVDLHEEWGRINWSADRLDERMKRESWTDEMREQAELESQEYLLEAERLRAGIRALQEDRQLLEAFKLMNSALEHSANGRFTEWRPFQMGFLLTALTGITGKDEARMNAVDTLWFATGGGKTETYLAAIVLLALLDRFNGKLSGVTAWSRFPLRMLSLQQTQRFADALAGAELARQQAGLDGDPFRIGFFVGSGGTPNKLRDDPGNGQPDASDPQMPANNRILLRCPFCFSDELEMRFNRRDWTLEHCCLNAECPWQETALPFHCVDEEIYRLLPTAVIGTLDKSTLFSMQKAARGIYGPPLGRCSKPGHGFTYAPRNANPTGCLVPDCTADVGNLGQDRELFGPGLRVQDELHLLRDSLGAIDSHYETLLDHLQEETTGSRPKILTSSATLAGHGEQVSEVYTRSGGTFPLPGPAAGSSYWTNDTDRMQRLFVGLAPRGQTLEFANERVTESLQKAIRELMDRPDKVAAAIGIKPELVEKVISDYGTNVVYGTKLRDVEAAARSYQNQPTVRPLNATQLTGRTELGDVRNVLRRLENPEDDFADRIHVVCATSMISHGVDIDRFNVITMLGLPLANAEFIQATARIGRARPGLVFVLHRMGMERDASVFRSFPTFVRQADRFVEPVAVTRRSKRVLRHTFPGVFMARILGIHEPRTLGSGSKRLVMARDFRTYNQEQPDFERDEFEAICHALGLDPGGEDPLIDEVRSEVRILMREANDPGSKATFINELPRMPVMRSLREVETQIPIISMDGRK